MIPRKHVSGKTFVFVQVAPTDELANFSKKICHERDIKVCDFSDCPCVKQLKYKTLAEEMIRGRFQKEIRK